MKVVGAPRDSSTPYIKNLAPDCNRIVLPRIFMVKSNWNRFSRKAVRHEKKYFAKLAGMFGIGFLILVSINYFVQISTVRMQIAMGQTSGLEQFIQANPISVMAAIKLKECLRGRRPVGLCINAR